MDELVGLPVPPASDVKPATRRNFPYIAGMRFQEHLINALREAQPTPRVLQRGECQSAGSQRCTLCYASLLDYENETRLKSDALQKFWGQCVPHTPLDPLVLSPKGRAYRTVTKRRAFFTPSRITLGLIDPAEDGRLTAFNVVRCAIEPGDHARVYAHVQEFLNARGSDSFAALLNYVVIKGTYAEYVILFNVRRITAEAVRICNRLSKSLTRSYPSITAVYLFEGQAKNGRVPTHYLEVRSPHAQRTFRKIFGENILHQKILSRSFVYSPRSFSQVNQSLFGQLIERAGELLQLRGHQTLYDLYCGYGPISLCLAENVRRIVGIDLSADAIASAIANAKRLHVANARFMRGQITARSLRALIKGMLYDDAVLLDPPRGGTAEGVIESIAAHRPRAVLHLICSIERLPAEVARWKNVQYKVIRGIPFDMFPGTAEIEMMMLLEPG